MNVEGSGRERMRSRARLKNEVAVQLDATGGVVHPQRAGGIPVDAVSSFGFALKSVVAANDQLAGADDQRSAGLNQIAVDGERVPVQVQTAVGDPVIAVNGHIPRERDVGFQNADSVVGEDRAAKVGCQASIMQIRHLHALGAAPDDRPVLKVNTNDEGAACVVDETDVPGGQRLHISGEKRVVSGFGAHGGENVDLVVIAAGGFVRLRIVVVFSGVLGFHAHLHIYICLCDENVDAQRNFQGGRDAALSFDGLIAYAESLDRLSAAALQRGDACAEGAREIRLHGHALIERQLDSDCADSKDAHLAEGNILQKILAGLQLRLNAPVAIEHNGDIAVGNGVRQAQVRQIHLGIGVAQGNRHAQLSVRIAEAVFVDGGAVRDYIGSGLEFIHIGRQFDDAFLVEQGIDGLVRLFHADDRFVALTAHGFGHISDRQILKIDDKGVPRRYFNRIADDSDDAVCVVYVDLRALGNHDGSLREAVPGRCVLSRGEGARHAEQADNDHGNGCQKVALGCHTDPPAWIFAFRIRRTASFAATRLRGFRRRTLHVGAALFPLRMCRPAREGAVRPPGRPRLPSPRVYANAETPHRRVSSFPRCNVPASKMPESRCIL